MNDIAVKKPPLEDIMAAMDVVDTLRHQSDIAQRELDGEGRRERLLKRLREMYAAQGIDVPDHILNDGIAALEEERFKYQPVPPSFATKLAHIWVSRTRWGKPFGFLAVLGSMFTGVYVATDVLPERQLRSGLPAKLEASVSTIRNLAKNPDVIEQAQQQLSNARSALSADNLESASEILSQIQSVERLLRTNYRVRVISRPGESSGVWRVPEQNPNGRNYYLIVEAIDNQNRAIELDILSEESNKRSKVKTWGLRVNEETFYKVAADKKDDGIIQSNQVGRKDVGYLQPDFSVPTTGATITEW